MANKPKANQPETPNEVQGRDTFSTPNYAVDLLVPFIPKNITRVWDCAAGDRKITNQLSFVHDYLEFSTDIREAEQVDIFNFLSDTSEYHLPPNTAIITNPPYSLKRKFYEKCREYKVPFALLIPFDMNQWLCNAFDKEGVQALVPNRRINYITPNGRQGQSSSAQFHSFWLTWGFSLPKQLTVVELSNKEMKENI